MGERMRGVFERATKQQDRSEKSQVSSVHIEKRRGDEVKCIGRVRGKEEEEKEKIKREKDATG